MLRPGGYAMILDPDAALIERDTITCGHCNRVVFVKPGSVATTYLIQHRDGRWTEEPGAGCTICGRSICLRCHDLGMCLPMERQLEQQERRRVHS